MVKISKILILFLVIGGMLAFGLNNKGAAQPELPLFVKEPAEKIERPLYVPDEIIVKFKPGATPAQIDQLNRQHGVEAIRTSKFAGFKTLRIPEGKGALEIVEIFTRNPLVEYAEPNYYAYATMVPNDPYYCLQWHLDDSLEWDSVNETCKTGSNPYGGIHMEAAWDISTGASSVIVAVVDTGVAYEDYKGFERAPDLAGTSFVTGYDFINNDNHPNDDEGHGTHVTGTIAQTTNNNLGVAGVAFNTTIMPVKALNQFGSGTTQTVADGIYFAADNGADIINLSLGWPVGVDPGLTLENAISYAYSQGVTIAAASGNEADEEGYTGGISYPAAYDDYVIAVGATRYDEEVAYYSNYGSSLDLTAPGGDVTIDQNEDGYGDGVLQQTFDRNPKDWGYWFYQGTSMSTPHVSGLAALLLAQDSNRTPDDIRNILQTTAEDQGAAGRDQYYGWGLIDAYAALTYAPVISITVTANDTFDYGTLGLSPNTSNPTKKNTVVLGKTPVIKNTGSVAVDLTVKSSDATGGTISWDLVAAGSIATDEYCHQYSTTTGAAWYDFPVSNDYTGTIFTGLSVNNSQNLDLQILMPTGSTNTAEKTITVTIRATQSD